MDELCATSSACIVAGDICEARPNPVAGPVFAAADAGLETLNGPACSKPGAETPDGAGADADAINDRTAPNAADAAPKANSMIKLQYAPPERQMPSCPSLLAQAFSPNLLASAVPGQTARERPAFLNSSAPVPPATDAVQGRFCPLVASTGGCHWVPTALPTGLAHVTRSRSACRNPLLESVHVPANCAASPDHRTVDPGG